MCSNEPTTIVVCLEGCHGSGKTKLCSEFSSAGFEVLDEAFLDQPEYALHPQSLVMETYWVSHWFQRLLKVHHELHNLNPVASNYRILLADRSPYSAVFYAKHGELLQDVISAQIQELRKSANIHVFTVNVNVEEELLWNRIQDRLKREPERKKYNEGSRAWFKRTLDFYQSFSWDFSVNNNEMFIRDVMYSLVMRLNSEFTTNHGLHPEIDPVWSDTVVAASPPRCS